MFPFLTYVKKALIVIATWLIDMHALMYNIFVVKKNYLFMKNQMSIMNVDSFTISMLLYQDAFLDVGVVVKNGKNICSKGLISCKMTCRSLL